MLKSMLYESLKGTH